MLLRQEAFQQETEICLTADDAANVKLLILLCEDFPLKSIALFLLRRSSESAELLPKRLLELLHLHQVGQEAADIRLVKRLTLMRADFLH